MKNSDVTFEPDESFETGEEVITTLFHKFRKHHSLTYQWYISSSLFKSHDTINKYSSVHPINFFLGGLMFSHFSWKFVYVM